MYRVAMSPLEQARASGSPIGTRDAMDSRSRSESAAFGCEHRIIGPAFLPKNSVDC
jgi:hypothetical protein